MNHSNRRIGLTTASEILRSETAAKKATSTNCELSSTMRLRFGLFKAYWFQLFHAKAVTNYIKEMAFLANISLM